jgi:hypothetical protein
LEEAAYLVTKSSFPKRLKDWVLHECHVFHLFARDWLYNIFFQMKVVPMIGVQCNCLSGSSHIPDVLL